MGEGRVCTEANASPGQNSKWKCIWSPEYVALLSK
jgi:hypothetical protein